MALVVLWVVVVVVKAGKGRLATLPEGHAHPSAPALAPLVLAIRVQSSQRVRTIVTRNHYSVPRNETGGRAGEKQTGVAGTSSDPSSNSMEECPAQGRAYSSVGCWEGQDTIGGSRRSDDGGTWYLRCFLLGNMSSACGGRKMR